MKIQSWSICKAIIVAIALAGHAAGQTPKSKQPPTSGVTRPGFSLRVYRKSVLSISLKTEGAKLADVAAELSKQLEIPVIVGRIAAKLQVMADFKGLLLEPALQVLAPEVYVDYEINPTPGVQIRPVGIYLNAYNELQPAINAVVPNKTDVIMVEGNTEEGQGELPAPADDENPLRVHYEGSLLTVKARKQSLMTVLAKISSELGIPLEFKTESDEIVELDIDKMSVEDAVQRMSPNVRLYVRADLYRFQRTPFRLVLVAPPKPSY